MRNTVHHPITNKIIAVKDTARVFTHAVVISTGVISMHGSEKAAHKGARAHNQSGYCILPVVDGDKPAPAPLKIHPAWFGRNEAGKWVEIKPAAPIERAPAAEPAPAVEPAPTPADAPAINPMMRAEIDAALARTGRWKASQYINVSTTTANLIIIEDHGDGKQSSHNVILYRNERGWHF